MGPILVTGAAGGAQGSTGRTVAEMLLERGQAVRALVRTADERAERLRGLGAEVVFGDLREISAVLPAMQGVRRVYFTYPVSDGLLDATAVLAAAAREVGVERVVNVSQLASAVDFPSPHSRRHWVAEQVLERAEVGAVHLRAAVFFENLAVVLDGHGGSELALPLGPPQTELPLVAAEDVARVAVGFLTAPPGDLDPVCPLTGQVASIGEAAAAFAAGAGAEVSYTPLEQEEWERRARRIYRDAVAEEHLARLWETFRHIGSGHELYEVTPVIAEIGGRQPLTLHEFARTHRAA
jgi:uncharacterized protein YbjT (DUF2867 family)